MVCYSFSVANEGQLTIRIDNVTEPFGLKTIAFYSGFKTLRQGSRFRWKLLMRNGIS